MSKHTPGIWVFRETGWQTFAGPHGLVVTEDGKPIATIAEDRTGMPILGNGYLIAAAPDLLAACKATVNMFRVNPDSSLPDDIKKQMTRAFQRDPTCQQVLAAIAKTEGDTP